MFCNYNTCNVTSCATPYRVISLHNHRVVISQQVRERSEEPRVVEADTLFCAAACRAVREKQKQRRGKSRAQTLQPNNVSAPQILLHEHATASGTNREGRPNAHHARFSHSRSLTYYLFIVFCLLVCFFISISLFIGPSLCIFPELDAISCFSAAHKRSVIIDSRMDEKQRKKKKKRKKESSKRERAPSDWDDLTGHWT